MTGASPGGRFVWIRLQLAAPDPAQPVQLVDVRDVGVLVRRLIDDDQPGTFQAVGQSLTIGAVLVECARGLASTRARFASVSTKTIRRRISDGTIPAYHCGRRHIVIRLDEFEGTLRRIPTIGW